MVHRRLARDYEVLPASSKAHIRIAMIDNPIKHVTGKDQGRINMNEMPCS